MKSISTYLIAGFILLSGCERLSEIDEYIDGTNVSINLQINYEGIPDEIEKKVNKDRFFVYLIKDQTDTLVDYRRYNDVSDTLRLANGDYKVIAQSGTPLMAATNHPSICVGRKEFLSK